MDGDKKLFFEESIKLNKIMFNVWGSTNLESEKNTGLQTHYAYLT